MNIQLPLQNMQRAKGEIDIALAADGLKRLYQSGSYKLLRPRRDASQGFLVNTAGGLTSGDRFSFKAHVEDGANLTISTQAAERIYQCHQGHAQVENNLSVENGARINWLPLETLIFDQANLKRQLNIELAASAEALIVEMIVFGRAAMGERISQMRVSDRYHISRAGTPIYAEHNALNETHLSHPFALNGASAFANIVLASPDAASTLEGVRQALSDMQIIGAASCRMDVLIIRMMANSAFELRKATHAIVEYLMPDELPLTWKL